MLERAQRLGIAPNTIMYNTAMSALAKSGRAEAAEQLFSEIPEPDAVSYEVCAVACMALNALQLHSVLSLCWFHCQPRHLRCAGSASAGAGWLWVCKLEESCTTLPVQRTGQVLSKHACVCWVPF